MAIVDPTGLYNLDNTCDQDDDKCNKKFNDEAKRLRDSVTALNNAVDKMKDSVEKSRLQASMKALGTENDGNNVNVGFGALSA